MRCKNQNLELRVRKVDLSDLSRANSTSAIAKWLKDNERTEAGNGGNNNEAQGQDNGYKNTLSNDFKCNSNVLHDKP